jgi:hypothetical protein
LHRFVHLPGTRSNLLSRPLFALKRQKYTNVCFELSEIKLHYESCL